MIRNKDVEHLKLLSIFHYVFGSLTALFSLFPIVHLIIGIVVGSGAFPTEGEEAFPEVIGWFFIIFASAFILIGETLAICLFVAATSLAQRRRYKFCFVIAAISCLSVPLGTVLGIFTIIVLCRPTVKTLFGRDSGAPVGGAQAESPYTPPPPPLPPMA